MRAIILVAGAGKKLRPHTNTQPKPLIPVAGKPILGHIIDTLLAVNLRNMIFVIGYMGEKIKTYVEENYSSQLEAQFVEQEPRLGTAHAIWLCKPHLQDSPSLILLGDTIIDADWSHILEEKESVLAVQTVEDPRKFGVAITDENGYITNLVEKPSIPKSNLALVGLYKINETQELLAAAQEIIEAKQKTHNEYQLTDVLMKMTQKGIRLKAYKVTNWFDCGKKDMLLETNRILLSRKGMTPLPQFENTVIIPPVCIAPGCEIKNSIIGPYVAIAENAKIYNSILQNTILGAYATLDSIVLNHSIIGNDSSVIGRSHAINIGDNTEIDFNA
ncbi:MAG: sugar phosphate nucleotidyltransferase [Bacteroidia bacterium]|nr:sugar phosphate nucleotidyltransferase [Bacteroidia bacterium]MDW8157349.1 sugar phosphate nucleotidyltransferase [Bacteroidia bacterium]